VVRYLSHLSEQYRTGVTRARKLAAIRAFCGYLVANATLEHSPAEEVKMPKKEKHSPVYLRVDEYLRLLTTAGGNSRDFAILQLFLQTGIRVSELVGLRLSDVDTTNWTLTIHAKNNKERLIYLERKGMQALKSYLSVRPQSLDTHLFLNYEGTGISARGVSDIVEKYRKQAGIQKKISCHSLRHTFATYKASMGVTAFQLKEMLGHDSINTSLLYVHMAMVDPRKLMQQTSL
jgi:site-specific recombinase XerD